MDLQQRIPHGQVSLKFRASLRLKTLIAAAHARGDEKAARRYALALGCQSVYVEKNGIWMPSLRCRSRACLVCSHIDSAIRTNRYTPALLQLTDPQFVTLTSPNVRAEHIGDELDIYIKVLHYCRVTMKRKGLPMVGVRNIEVTFSPSADGKAFNVHAHLIVEGKRAAELLRQCWIGRLPRVNAAAQTISPIDQGAVGKVFSYGNKPGSSYGSPGHDIYNAIYRRKLFSAYGIKPVEQKKKADKAANASRDYIIRAIYDHDQHDYVNSNGLPITGYDPLTDRRTPNEVKAKLRHNGGSLIHT